MQRKTLTKCYKFIVTLSRKYITLQIHTFFVKKCPHYIIDFKNFVPHPKKFASFPALIATLQAASLRGAKMT